MIGVNFGTRMYTAVDKQYYQTIKNDAKYGSVWGGNRISLLRK